MKNIKVLVISNIPFFLDGIKAFLDSKYIDAVFKNYDGIFENIKMHLPGIVVLDENTDCTDSEHGLTQIKNCPGDGIKLASLISDIIKNNPGIKIIVYTENNNTACLRKLIDAGIKALLYTKGDKELLYKALEQVEKGKIHFDDYFNSEVFTQLQNVEEQKENCLNMLSHRENAILNLIGNGLKNHEIAEKLFLSTRTIETYKTHIIKKLNLASSAALTVFAANNCKTKS